MSVTCYHVSTADGQVYGAAATSKRDAMVMVQERLAGEDGGDQPVSAQNMGPWSAEYGTVLHYGPTHAA